jgi:hypothetical protein
MAGLAVVWLLGMGWALFQLQTAGQRLFDPAVLEGTEIPDQELAQRLRDAVPTSGQPLLIHAWDDGCECADAAWQHLLSITDRVVESGVGVVLLVRPDAIGRAELAQQQAIAAGLPVVSLLVDTKAELMPASPAAAVLGGSGELLYLGPYSAGGSCVTSIGGFVESTLGSLAEPMGARSAWINRTAIGCYCDWRPTPTIDA